MANLLAYGFGSPKSQKILAPSASEDVFVTIRGMAGRGETISSLTVKSLLAESDSLLTESKAHVAIAIDQDDEHAYEWEVAIQLSDSHKQKKEEGLLLHTKLLAFVEARKSARFLLERAEDANDVRAIREWHPVVKAAKKFWLFTMRKRFQTSRRESKRKGLNVRPHRREGATMIPLESTRRKKPTTTRRRMMNALISKYRRLQSTRKVASGRGGRGVRLLSTKLTKLAGILAL
jgi:hypothetical protein